MHRLHVFISLIATLALSSCEVYKQHILFRDDGSVDLSTLKMDSAEAEQLYTLKPYDQFTLQVYTGNGERIIDPEFELLRDMGAMGNQVQGRPNPTYIVQPDSTVRLPMIGTLKVAGYTQQEAEVAIQEAFLEYYEDTYAVISLESRRVIVLGAPGGQVIPLPYDGMTVLEVLAAAGGIPPNSKGQNVRLIRPPFENPQIEVIDLTSISGMQQAQLHVQPGDVIYVEPRPLVLQNSLRDVAPILNLLSSGFAIVVVILNIANG